MSSSVLGRQWSREALRDDVRLAVQAQEQRAAAVGADASTRTRAGRVTEERRGFFGSGNAAASDHAEQRVTVTSADREHAARVASDREQAAAHVPMDDHELHETHRALRDMGW